MCSPAFHKTGFTYVYIYIHIYISMFIHIVLASVPIGLTSPKLVPRGVGHPWGHFPTYCIYIHIYTYIYIYIYRPPLGLMW